MYRAIEIENSEANYLNCGTLRGRRRLLTTGGISLDLGNAGLLAQRAALVSCETREKFRSGPEVVRKTFLILDFNPEDGGNRGAVGMGTTCTKRVPSEGSSVARTSYVSTEVASLPFLAVPSPLARVRYPIDTTSIFPAVGAWRTSRSLRHRRTFRRIWPTVPPSVPVHGPSALDSRLNRVK